MFPLYERTRWWICRILFLLVGVLPTTAVLGWCWCASSPSQATAVRAELQSALGLKVELTQVFFPRPGCTLINDLQLADPETGDTVATMRRLEICTTHYGKLITASQPEVDLAHVQTLVTLISRHLHAALPNDQKEIHLTASELTMHWPGGNQTMVDWGTFFESTDDTQRASFVFRLPGTPAVDASRQVAQFERRKDSAAHEVTDNYDIVIAGLPYPLICTILGQQNHLGQQCVLTAKLQGHETPDGWQAELNGQLQNIDLHSAISEQFPHQLSGSADLNINHAVFHAGRLEEAAGNLHAGPGSISPSLLLAAASLLGLQRGTAENLASAPQGNVPYEELSADFALDSNGLTLYGKCGGKRPGVVLRNGEQSILTESNRGPVAVLALVKMLVPDSRLQVPATRQTDELLRLLPIPDILPGDPQAVPQARIRGGKDLH